MVLVVLEPTGGKVILGIDSVQKCTYTRRIDFFPTGKPPCRQPRMLFPGPETTLGGTIDSATEPCFIRRKRTRPRDCQGPSTTFQSLTPRLNNLEKIDGAASDETRSPWPRDGSAATNTEDIPVQRADGDAKHPARTPRSIARAIPARGPGRRGSYSARTARTRSLPIPAWQP
jgi:hypothetical protein